MTDAELAHTKELAFWMTERVFMNPISAKLLNEDWRKAFPDDVAVAERMKALVEALESAQRKIAELDDKCASHLKDARMFREAHDSASEIIRRLESKTLVVTMPTTKYQWGGGVLNTIDPADMLDALRKACAAVGIKCEVKGE